MTHDSSGPSVRTALLFMLIPLLIGIGMTSAYIGAFHAPDPDGVRVDVIGSKDAVAPIAAALQERLGSAIDVDTTDTPGSAESAIAHRDISAAVAFEASGPTLYYSDAAAPSTAQIIINAFQEYASAKGQSLVLKNVVPAESGGDPTGQSIFFYLIGLSVGSYAGGVAIGAAAGHLRMRTRVGLAVGLAPVMALACTVLAGAVFGALPDHGLEIGLLGWLYATGITLVGVGLHTLLGRLTMPVMTGLFVMLNFTSAGGLFEPNFQPGLFRALHGFWNGAALQEAGRNLLYFPEVGNGRYILTLVLWLVFAVALVALATVIERKRGVAPSDEFDEEMSFA